MKQIETWTKPPKKPPKYYRKLTGERPTVKNQVGAHSRLVWDDEKGYRRCTANAKGSGDRCKRAPIPGGTVCNMHGGGSPSARRKGQNNLMEMLDPANARIARIISNPNTKDTDLIRIWENLLDRLGYPRNMEIGVEDIRDQILNAVAEVDEDTLQEIIEGEVVEDDEDGGEVEQE